MRSELIEEKQEENVRQHTELNKMATRDIKSVVNQRENVTCEVCCSKIVDIPRDVQLLS